jgi:hypothetical protein
MDWRPEGGSAPPSQFQFVGRFYAPVRLRSRMLLISAG